MLPSRSGMNGSARTSRTRPRIAYPRFGAFFLRASGTWTLGRQVEIEQTWPWPKTLLVLASWPFAGAVVASSANYTTLAQVLFWLAFTMFVAGGILEIRRKGLSE
jgi:hypothetical protein